MLPFDRKKLFRGFWDLLECAVNIVKGDEPLVFENFGGSGKNGTDSGCLTSLERGLRALRVGFSGILLVFLLWKLVITGSTSFYFLSFIC